MAPGDPPLVAGLPAALRTAHRLAAQETAGQVLLCGAGADPFAGRAALFSRLPVRAASREGLARALEPLAPILVVAPDGMPDAQGLRRFLEEASKAGQPAIWTWEGRPVCLYEPQARRLAAGAASWPANPFDSPIAPPAALRLEAREGEWMPLGSVTERAAAEKRIYTSLSHGRDGYISQFDRRISIPLSRRLARTRVTPNQVTAVSIVVGLAGAALLASPDRAACFSGALLAWFSSILDGCDGELARLKLLFSEAGRRFDLFGDYVVNFSVLAAVAWHVHRVRPELTLLPLAALLASGVALSALCVWWLFVRHPGRGPGGLLQAFQRLASRDFVYLILVLAALDRLDVFVYAAAFGSHLFWISLCVVLALRRRAVATA